MTIIPFPGLKDQAASCCGKPGRIALLRLPTARRPFARIRFAAPESARALLPAEALSALKATMEQGAVPAHVELDGPGDPLADWPATRETLHVVRGAYPDIELGIATLGIGGEQHAEALAAAGVSRVTLLVDAVDQSVMQELYSWIRPGTKTIHLSRATAILQDEQLRALKAFAAVGLKVTVKTTIYPGYNSAHVDEIVYRAATHGAEAMMILPYRPHADDPDLPPAADGEMMDLIHSRAAKRIKVVGERGADDRKGTAPIAPSSCRETVPAPAKPTKERPMVAVVSSNGMEVDLHLGHAVRVLIYGPREDGLICLLETRDAPQPGGGGARWEVLADILQDCFILLAASAGKNPRTILGRRGISVLITEGEIESLVDVLYGGGKKKSKRK